MLSLLLFEWGMVGKNKSSPVNTPSSEKKFFCGKICVPSAYFFGKISGELWMEPDFGRKFLRNSNFAPNQNIEMGGKI